MANMTTILTEFADNGNSRTYAAPAHTVQAPRLVIQKRTVPATLGGVSESSAKVVFGTTDALGVPLLQKISFEAVRVFQWVPRQLISLQRLRCFVRWLRLTTSPMW